MFITWIMEDERYGIKGTAVFFDGCAGGEYHKGGESFAHYTADSVPADDTTGRRTGGFSVSQK